ncbi:hypothetical protein IWW46_000973 [Coemansia sp. RSA 2440]|nr:hypothetical protein IWW46_000973 [Coemansia sp. RSA 2440]
MYVRLVILFIGMVAVGLSSPVPDTGVAMPESDKTTSGTHQQHLARNILPRAYFPPPMGYPPLAFIP